MSGATPQVKAVYWDGQGKAFSAQFLPDDLSEFTDEAEVTFTEITGDYVKDRFLV